MRLGAFDHLTKPIGRDELDLLLKRLPGRWTMPATAGDTKKPGTLTGSSEAIRNVQKTIGLTADSDATILIFSGRYWNGQGACRPCPARTRQPQGKALCRRQLRRHSGGAPGKRTVRHVRGSFTGLTAYCSGAFRDAEDGTLFYEIGICRP